MTLAKPLVVILLALASLPAEAINRNYFSLYGQYSSYTDIRNDSANPAREIPGDISLNLDFRVHRIFIMILHGGQSSDGFRNFWGLGFKVDLPGFFLLNGNIQDFIRKKKRRGVNTSVYWKTYVLSEMHQTSNLVGNRFGAVMDFFLSRQTYINFDLGIYSDNGNQYLSPSVGLGYEF